LDEKKSKHAGLAHHKKSFGPASFLHNLLLRLAKGTHSKALHLPEKSVSKYYVTNCCSLFLIGEPGGLLLLTTVFSELFAIPILVLWVGLLPKKST
jgi:hypothetical protein